LFPQAASAADAWAMRGLDARAALAEPRLSWARGEAPASRRLRQVQPPLAEPGRAQALLP